VDHYRTLQVTRDADAEVIERAYRALSLKHHPDVASHADLEGATRRMQAINEAYRTLRDPERRRRYDATLPPENPQAWDVFWERGLLGMFVERFMPRT
jgi:DnaJ-class molecular chaperone